MIPTYTELMAVINRTRYSMTAGEPIDPTSDWIGEVRHLDTLEAILRIHDGIECQAHCANPCPEQVIVVDALTQMGAL